MKSLKMKKVAFVATSTAATIGVVSLLFAFFNKTSKEYRVKPPIAGHNVPYHEFTYEPTKGAHFVDYCFGHQVNIAPNSLVDAHGNPVEREVKLSFRTFNDAKEIFLSGIPMGSQYGQLQSAGMFELKAEDHEVFISENGGVEVNLVSRISDPSDYNAYIFEEGAGWVEIEKFKIEENKLREESIVELDTLINIGKREQNKKKERRKRNENFFKLDFKGEVNNGVESKALRNITWEYVEVKGQDNPFKGRNQRMPWNSARVTKNNDGTYQIRLTNIMTGKKAKEVVLSFTAIPVLDSDNPEMELAALDAEIADFNEYFQALEDQQRMWAKQKAVYNTFSLSNWGIYNCDKVINEPSLANGEVDIKLNDSDDINGNELFVLYDSINSVIQFSLMDDIDGRDIVLTQDYDGEIELFLITNDGQLYSKIIDHALIPKSINIDELASIETLSQFVN